MTQKECKTIIAGFTALKSEHEVRIINKFADAFNGSRRCCTGFINDICEEGGWKELAYLKFKDFNIGYCEEEEAIVKTFEKFKDNTNFNEILPKVTLIDNYIVLNYIYQKMAIRCRFGRCRKE